MSRKSRSSRNTSGEAPLPATPPPEVSDASLESAPESAPQPDAEPRLVDRPEPTVETKTDENVLVKAVFEIHRNGEIHKPGSELLLPLDEVERLGPAVARA